jgi:hypothetical protein
MKTAGHPTTGIRGQRLDNVRPTGAQKRGAETNCLTRAVA